MAGQIVPQEPPIGQDWEEELYQEGCARMREEARHRLQEMEDWLYQQAPSDWKVVGFRERTMVCRFGPVTVSRRLYRDGEGRFHFLLDEHLGWESHRAATPSLQEAALHLTAMTSFREAAQALEKMTAGVLSPSTLHRLVQKVAEKAVAQEREEVEACFGRGEEPERGEWVVPRLFLEADGVSVHLQRQEQRYGEVRVAIGYEGWERLPQAQERYRLIGKRVYCQGDEQIDFWEGVILALGRRWDWSRISLVVINGDGAKWIDEGVKNFERAIRQLDGFHLARSCYQAGGEQGAVLYEAIRKGNWGQAREVLGRLRPNKEGGRARAWVARVIEEKRGADWHIQAGLGMEEERGMGTIEGNEAQLLSRRLGGKGMSWGIQGARAMAKVRELLANGESNRWCGRRTAYTSARAKPTVPVRAGGRKRNDPGEWLQVKVPALYGPEASRPWVETLRQLIYPPDLLN